MSKKNKNNNINQIPSINPVSETPVSDNTNPIEGTPIVEELIPTNELSDLADPISEIPVEEIPIPDGLTEEELKAIEENVEKLNIESIMSIPVEDKKPVEAAHTISNPTEIKQPEPEKKKEVESKIIGTVFTKGKLVKLTRIPLYTGPMTLFPVKYLTGNYFIYDGIERAGRYRICKARTECGKGTKYIEGYIEKKNLK